MSAASVTRFACAWWAACLLVGSLVRLVSLHPQTPPVLHGNGLRQQLAARTTLAASRFNQLQPQQPGQPQVDASRLPEESSQISARWHAIAPDGACPAPVPLWDWQLLLDATLAEGPAERYKAFEAMRRTSNLEVGELQDLIHRYRQKLREPEFLPILEPEHPPCGGRQFATLDADRILRMDCADGRGAYALDAERQRHTYERPTYIEAETVFAFCGDDELLLISRPRRRSDVAARVASVARDHAARREEKAAAQQGGAAAEDLRRRGRRLPKVVVLMIDATSRAHFVRSMPRTLAALRTLGRVDWADADAAAAAGSASSSTPTARNGSFGGARPDGDVGARHSGMSERQERADAPAPGRLHVFDFEHYNIVGFNSIPNQMPLFCGVPPAGLSSLRADQCIWELARQHGSVTMMADEIHDGCQSPCALPPSWNPLTSGSPAPAPALFCPALPCRCSRRLRMPPRVPHTDVAWRRTTPIQSIMQSSWLVPSSSLPDHAFWNLFCSPHVPPCCWAPRGFLNPGRRQCVGGGKELHQIELGYLESFLETYADSPRLWVRILPQGWPLCAARTLSRVALIVWQASVNTMVAHEHFMLRLPSLDEVLAAMLLRLAPTHLQVMFIPPPTL